MKNRNRGWSKSVGVRKLKEASFFLERLMQAETNEAASYFLSAFLSAGPSLAAALEKRFKPSYSAWRLTRTEPERALLNFMTAERDDEVHEAGASRGATVCVPSLFVDGRTGTVSTSSAGGTFITFDYGGEVVPAAPMCERYLILLRAALETVYREGTPGEERAVEQADDQRGRGKRRRARS